MLIILIIDRMDDNIDNRSIECDIEMIDLAISFEISETTSL